MRRLSTLDRQSRALQLRRLAPWAVVGLLAAGCLLDDGDRCGENQVLWGGHARCVCGEGFVASAKGCVACGAHEVSDPVLGCACEDGFARSGAGTPCEALPPDVHPPSGVGTPCTSDAVCAGFDANYCELVVSHSCLVKNCTTAPNNCFQGFECCDLTSFGLPTLCLANGLCMQ